MAGRDFFNIARCASVLAVPAGSSPEQLVIDLFAQHAASAICCMLSIDCDLESRKDLLLYVLSTNILSAMLEASKLILKGMWAVIGQVLF